MSELNPFDFYPSQDEINAWIDALWKAADTHPCTATCLNDFGDRIHMGPFFCNHSSFFRFEQPEMRPFFGMWSSSIGAPRPLVVHIPGYGAELAFHPDIVGANYNVLELSPLGYWTPNGFLDDLRMSDGTWPVLANSVIDAYSMESYFGWMLNVIGAVKWAMNQPSVLPGRVSFFGTSQGGGTSLLLGSIFRDHGTQCVCADEPFLTNYPMSTWRGAYYVSKMGFDQTDEKTAWHNLGLVDTIAHAPRMTYPVFMTLGTCDTTCPPENIRDLFDRIDADKMLLSLKDRGHGYQFEFDRHVLSWLNLYA